MKNKTLRILIVDDSRAVHAFLKECLWEKLPVIEQVFDGSQALELLKSRQSDFDLILLDWEMPKVTGPDTFKEIRRSQINIPVIMMTTRNSAEDIHSMILAGISDYMMKPFTKDILFEKIDRVLEEVSNAA